MKKLKLAELNRISIEEFKGKPKSNFAIVLDNVRSALNVGSAFRTADSFRANSLHLTGITAQPPHKEIMKTAIGATASVSWKYHRTSKEAILYLKEEGFWIVGIEQVDESVSLNDFAPTSDQPIAYIFGNEVEGISDDILPLLDTAVEIPQFGTKHSLNISVCVGIIGWHHILLAGQPNQ